MLPRRNVCALAAALSFVAGAAAPDAATAAEQTIKIGVLVELSGPFAPYGRQITNAAEIDATTARFWRRPGSISMRTRHRVSAIAVLRARN